ncbi:dipeptidase. Metallo peptidase. MEROPS family M19 [Marininema mesophilum]|uniref:Dipeptidase. Metallo peptidase. MEROPS family M19 n=1 Tax=Marininema mesophilum TaxID=1048340 RepID=A0A1H2ZDU3_9BACL|nr:membrane dipeptidase [Marininema mesophilum]SDX15515.1 dipeptidase. Metallo peptidase. MEROPS family M19 [Marininema mesophilum]
MKWIDGHCDVLYKMYMDPQNHSFMSEQSWLDVTWPRIKQSKVGLQVFAIYVPQRVPRHGTWDVALKQVDYFYERVIGERGPLFHVQNRDDLIQLRQGRPSALLAIEGVDSLQGELAYLRLLYRLGLRQVGLTWNYANEAADGILEERDGGLTTFGWQLVKEMERLGLILDVSHLSVRGFWEVVQQVRTPVIASHSNCRALCSHVRNLADDQIRALIQRQGLMGITFVPQFVHTDPKQASIDDLLGHVEHVCSLGGEGILTFGSDFDGIENKIPYLEHAGHWDHWWNALLKHYPESLVYRWSAGNALQFYERSLP